MGLAEDLKALQELRDKGELSESAYAAARDAALVDYKSVRVVSHRVKSTCFSVAADPDMPRAEVVASALLQLKNNPRLFEKWRELRGYTFKANGQMFRSIRRCRIQRGGGAENVL